jgi:hypothetical protein
MKSTVALSKLPKAQFAGVKRRFEEFSLIFRDPVLFMGLLFSGIFIFVFVLLPLSIPFLAFIIRMASGT